MDISFTVGVHDKRKNSQEWFLKGAPEELTDYMYGVIELITRPTLKLQWITGLNHGYRLCFVEFDIQSW